MRKALLITIVFLLLTLSITQSAIAQRQNIITNQTTEPLYVVYSTKFGAHGAIPAGYWTAGWKEIPAGQQEAFWAYDPHKIYFQIWKGGRPVKPLSSTQTLAFWINRNADFNVVTQQEINASITRGQLVYSSHDTSALTHSDGFMRYNNGSRITVTNAWVNVDADVNAGLDSVTDRQVFVWDPVEILRGHTGAINALAWHPTNSQRLASGSSDKAVRVWHFAEITTSVPLVGHTGAVLDVAWNSAGTELNSAGSDGTVRIWDPTIGSLIEVRLEKAHPIVAISFKRNLWFYTTEPEETSLDLSWDTKHAVVGLTDNTIQVWSVEPLNHLRDLTGHTGSVNAVVWSPDDMRIVSGSADRTVRVWDPQTGELLKTLRGHTGAINTVAWSPDGTRIVSGSDDGTVRVWDADVGALLETLTRHTGAINAVAWSPDGTRIASGGADRTIWIWEKPEDSDMMSDGVAEDVFDDGPSDGFAEDPSQPVNIPDPDLRSAIEKELGKAPGATISEADMLTLITLYRSYKPDLQDLTGLEFATNLKRLSFSNFGTTGGEPYERGKLSDISPLVGLTNLTHLNLAKNRISDISPLAGLTNLQSLDLFDNQISDISPLAGLTNLQSLNLRYNEISDFSPIAGLIPNLRNYHKNYQRAVGSIEEVNIPDRTLQTSIEKELDKTSGHTITKGDMSRLSELSISPSPLLRDLPAIQDLTGLEFATNLKVLDITDHQISDISPLSGLTNLIRLRLDDNQISDVSPLVQLKSLKGLHLSDNQISDVTPLAQLKNLTQLSLDGNQISDVSPLAGLTNLTSLLLYSNEISDFSPIAGLIPNLSSYWNHSQQRGLDTPVTIPDRDLRAVIEKRLGKTSGATITGTEMRTLTKFEAKEQDIQNLTGLEFATNLTKLDLLGNQISDLSPLTKLKNLTELDISKQTLIEVDGFYGDIIYLLSDLSPLAELKNLTSLDLSGNQLSDLSPLAELKNLTSLDLWSNRISDLSPLTKLKNLIELYLGGNRISDLSPLAELKNLTSLSLTDNHQISDLSPLTKLKNLTSLSLKNNHQISDYSPLAELKNLTSLSLEGNLISDLSPLAELKNLTSLNLEGNRMSDLSPLTKLKNLIELYLGYNHQISDYSPLLLLPRLSVVKGNGIDGIHALHAAITKTDGCTFNMPQTYGRLQPSTHVYSISRKPSQGGVSGNVGFVQSAPIVSDNATLNWTYKTTVASESEKDPTTITIKFLNGNKNEKDIVIEAARTWESFGYLHFKFLHPGQSGASDIRVKFEYNYLREVKSETKVVNGVEEIEYIPTGKTFGAAAWGTYEPPSENHGLLSFSDFRSYYGTLANEVKGGATMFFTTNFGRGTALHELGHALGLTHEHLSPKFKDYFEWVDIEAVYTYFQSIESWPREKVADNVVNTVPVATNLPGVDFDPESVMTYGIPAELIKARPNAPSWAKSAAINGIEKNFDLSEGDEKIMAVLYPKPRDFVVSGEITVHAKDDDFDGFPFFDDDDYYDDRDNPRLFRFEHTHHSPLVKYIYKVGYTYTWADEECRVEVHLVVRNFINNGLELGVYALLYEGREGTGRWTDDLEDIACKTVSVPLYNSRKVERGLKNRGLSELQFANTRCADLYSHGKIYLGDASGGGDWANITVKFEVEDPIVATSLAPSLVSIQDASSMDVNGDGHVDTADLLLVSNYIGQTGSIDPRVDANGDGIVTIADLVLVAQHLGSSTYASAPIGVVPVGLKYSTVVGWIDQARIEDDGSLVFQQGLAKLEYLLTLIIPEKTALLPNYPNPFNPETWIPYHLAEPAEVRLTIYAINGRVVRRLDLGHQDAGYYQSKSRAAYWDGRNNVGERVASGIYFYTLTVGDFAATKKLLIRK